MKMHHRLAALLSCLVLAPALIPASAGATTATVGEVTSVSDGGRLVLYNDDPARFNEVVLPDSGAYEWFVKTQEWAFTYHRGDKNYTIGLPDYDLCWHREQLADRIRVKVDTCSSAKSARWVLEPAKSNDNRRSTVVIRPANRMNEALTVGNASGAKWSYVILRGYNDLDTQHWEVPVQVGGVR